MPAERLRRSEVHGTKDVVVRGALPCPFRQRGLSPLVGGSSYKTPGSRYQNAVAYGVYRYIDLLSICWVNTVSTDSGFSIALLSLIHPDGSTNLDYLQWIVADARAANAGIRIVAMMGYGDDEIS